MHRKSDVKTSVNIFLQGLTDAPNFDVNDRAVQRTRVKACETMASISSASLVLIIIVKPW